MEQPLVYDPKGTPVGTKSKAIFNVAATGSWQDISLPTGLECKSILIMARNNDDTVYTRDPVEFHMKSSSTATDWAPLTQLAMQDIIEPGGYIGTFKAEEGNYLVFIVAW